MKRKIVFMLSMIISFISFGQEQRSRIMDEIRVVPPRFTGIERVPVLVRDAGSEELLENYVMNNIQYPQEAIDYYSEGTEVVNFVVTGEGEVDNFTIINSVSPEIDKEVIRVLKTTSGMWTPGYNNEEPVAMEKEISILFKINPNKDFLHETEKIFSLGSTMLLIKEKPKRALRIYDRGIVLMPSEKSLLLMRGLTRYELGDKDGACRDWTRIKSLGGNSDFYLDQYCEMKGYADMVQILGK